MRHPLLVLTEANNQLKAVDRRRARWGPVRLATTAVLRGSATSRARYTVPRVVVDEDVTR